MYSIHPKFLAGIVLFLIALNGYGLNKFHCIESFGSSYQYGSTAAGSLKVSNNADSPEKPNRLKITIIGADGAILDGNQGRSVLARISQNQFIEKAELGNIILWTFFRDVRKVAYSILVSQKSYDYFSNPMTFTAVYECRRSENE